MAYLGRKGTRQKFLSLLVPRIALYISRTIDTVALLCGLFITGTLFPTVRILFITGEAA